MQIARTGLQHMMHNTTAMLQQCTPSQLLQCLTRMSALLSQLGRVESSDQLGCNLC
jgi:hypothetical protein